MRRVIWTLLCGFFWGSTVWAQSVPDHRMIVTRDVDFYGSDLQAIFDTDLPSCVAACAIDPACQAFTFNARSNACFPKSQVSDRTPYDGAISAEKRATDPRILAQAETARAAIGFVSDAGIADAADLAQRLSLSHPAGAADLDRLLAAAQAQRSQGDTAGAASWIAAAVALTDRADLWTEYARLNLALDLQSGQARRDANRRAVLAAVNGYLRSLSDAGRANALVQMARALERSGQGRDTISALRLALRTTPRPDIETALDAAIAKYGFRIVDTRVESDAAAPRICAEFSEPLAKGVDYAPFVRLPTANLAVQAEDRQICVDGVEHATRYRLTLRSGLPAASGEVLVRDVEVTHYVRDRTPLLRFPGRTYVLPKTAEAALPVETVNLRTLELKLRKVSDRNLLRAVQDRYFGRPLSQWEDDAFADTIAEEVWTGSAEVQMTLNRTMTTRLPLGDVLRDLPTGIYALNARDADANPYDDAGATQWFVLSDLGVTSFAGTDGLSVSVRGLSDAQPRADVRLTLVSRANDILGETVTDAQGFARFAPGLIRGRSGGAPALLLAQSGEDDLTFLSLSDPAFDLSDRGVAGRPPAGPVDAFVTTDRGAYRAGETIHLTALLRDPDARAIADMPLTAIVTRPDGVIHTRRVSPQGVAGGHVFAVPLGLTVPRGTWTLAVATSEDGPTLASTQVLVEDFLPERIDFDLSLSEARVQPGAVTDVDIAARYLFGAPGAGLSVEGSVSLRGVRTLPDWPGYVFGQHDDGTQPASTVFSGGPTSANGTLTLPVTVPPSDVSDRPFDMTVTARLTEGSGRPVERQTSTLVQPSGPIIGVRPLFEDVVADGAEAGFQIIALSPDLSPRNMDITWTLNRIETRYQWYQFYGDWNWEPITRRSRIATGQGQIGDTPLTLTLPVEWGEYELVVEHAGQPYTATSETFYAGWYAPADQTDTPDTLDVSLDRPDYAPGDTAQLRLVSRFAGTALISVLSDRVISRLSVEVTAGETVVPVPVTNDWGAGAYVTAMVVRPMDVPAGQNPARALGLAYAAVAPGDRQLTVGITAPDVIRPRGTLRAGITVDGATAGDEVWITLAAVDVGILNLTGFAAPDPSAYYFGQRRLGVEMRDLYGRLIDGMNGALGRVRSGGDGSSGLRMQSPPPTEDLMAQFSGPVRVDAEGRAFVNVDIPAFNGTVRLMAVAWSARGVGHASTDVISRDPVVATVSLPRFLAPGDTSRMRIELAHAEGPSGTVGVQITAPPDVALETRATEVMVRDGGRQVLDLALSSDKIGDHPLGLTLTTPDGTELTQTFTLPVRINDPEIAMTRRFALADGDTLRLDTDIFANMRPGTGTALVSAGPLAQFDAPGLLSTLDRYPYGCTEQVASQALPLLYLSAVAEAAGLGASSDIDARIVQAVDQVLTRQTGSGSFGLWRAEADGDLWLDAYVTDFLTRAQAEGHDIPPQNLRMALDNLRNRVNFAPDFDWGGEDIAYALLVLARQGTASMADLRYYADQKAEAFATPLALAQVAAALAAYGDQLRADALFEQAQDRLSAGTVPESPVWRSDYGTPLRDAAAVLTLASEAGSDRVNRTDLTQRVTRPGPHLSTQEAVWSLMAAHAALDGPAAPVLSINGTPVDGPMVRALEDTAQIDMLAITTSRSTDVTLTTLGVPLQAPDAGGSGFAITRTFFDLEGTPLDPGAVTVGQRFVTVIDVQPAFDGGARLMVNDPLPAGVEIDNPSLLRAGDIRALDWLEPSIARHVEFRSDRFLAAVDIGGPSPVTLAYIARAVTPGVYRHPAASVEDMYRPRFRAHTASDQMVVTE